MTAPKPEQPDPPQNAETPYDFNSEEPIQPAISDPRHVNGRAEALGGHTINPKMRQAQPVFTVSFRKPGAGFPERTEPSPSRTSPPFDLFTGKPF